MNWIIDIIAVIIFLICTILGYKKGLVAMAISIASFFVAVILAFLLCNPLTNIIIENTEFDENIENMIIENFVKKSEEKQETDNIPEVVVNFIEEKVTEVKNTSIESSAKNISHICIRGLSFICILIITKIGIFIIGKFADILTELPVLKQFNYAGGLAVGAIKGLLIIYILLALISLMIPVFENTGIYTAINNSYICKFMYDYNLLLKIIF